MPGGRQHSAGGRLAAWARRIVQDVHALSLAARDPRVPWYAKLLAVAVAGYALSPIDLIPDFVPVVGYLDDLLILPAGISLAVRMVAPEVMAECRAAARAVDRKPISVVGAVVVVAGWLVAAVVVAVIVRQIV